MRYQDQVVRSTQRALSDLGRAALAVPEEKRTWVPMGEARSVLDQMQEIAAASGWFRLLIEGRRAPDETGDAIREGVNEARRLASVEACLEKAHQSTAELCRVIAEFPDEELEDEVRMPFGGGMSMTYAEVLSLHWWNMVYHLGQINSIQLMLGDKVMH